MNYENFKDKCKFINIDFSFPINVLFIPRVVVFTRETNLNNLEFLKENTTDKERRIVFGRRIRNMAKMIIFFVSRPINVNLLIYRIKVWATHLLQFQLKFQGQEQIWEFLKTVVWG